MPPLIRTVTLNPAIDEAVSIRRFELGRTNRSSLDSIDPGGKGVNASRVIHRLGHPTLAFGVVGGVTGDELLRRLADEGVPFEMERVAGETRVNVMIFETDEHRRTRLYLPGQSVAVDVLAEIERKLRAAAADEIVILGGSLPPGLPVHTYARLCALLRERGIRCVVDTSGEPLALALRAGPYLVKPNVEEAEEVLGRSLRSDGELLDGARELVGRGARYAVISRGERGALAASVDEAWQAIPPSAFGGSAVGAGDSMTAGIAVALSEGAPFADALRLGMACGAATAMTFGTKLGDPQIARSLVPKITVESLASPHAAGNPARETPGGEAIAT